MNQWANTILTDKGTALLAKLTQGNTLTITKAVIGAGYVNPTLLAKQTAVTDPKDTLAFRPVAYPEEGKCSITVAMNNDATTAGYTVLQVGIFAQDPDDGEILFLISQAANNTSGTIVPSATEMPGFSAEWTFYLAYGQADSVEVTVDPAGGVTREEMETYVDGKTRTSAGKIVEGEVFTIDDKNVTAAAGAEIFNNYEKNKATGEYAHAEGSYTQATGRYAHAEGNSTEAKGQMAHAEGSATKASGIASHTEGTNSKAVGDNSHAEGLTTIAAGEEQHVQGRFNVEDTEGKYAHIVGNGKNVNERSNAHTLDWEGNAWFAGAVDVEDPDTTRANLKAAPAYTYGTSDLTAGESKLETGVLYFVYE